MKSKALKWFVALLALTATLSCLAGCCYVPTKSLVLSNSELTINIGNSGSVTCTVLPESATNKTVEWSSSDPNVATVNDVGVITAVSAGTCTITASSGKVSASVIVTVKKPVEQIVLDTYDLTVNEEETFTFTCIIVPDDASDKTVTWASSDNSVATVDEFGTVTGISAGSCTVTASSDKITASVAVRVKKPVEQVTLNSYSVTIKEEETFSFTCTIVPDDASDKNVTWTSSNSSVAAVDESGTITGISAGSCTVTATVDGISAVANITVKKKGPDLKKLYSEISSNAQHGWTLASDYSYLMADTNSYNWSSYLDTPVWNSIKDMNRKLGLPETVDSDMGRTSFLMGRQTRTFEEIGITVSWTYHPNQGLEVTYSLINP